MKTVIRDVRSRLFFSGTGVLLGVAFVFSLIALWPRWRAETEYRDVAIVADYSDVVGLSAMSGRSRAEVFDLLRKSVDSVLMVT